VERRFRRRRGCKVTTRHDQAMLRGDVRSATWSGMHQPGSKSTNPPPRTEHAKAVQGVARSSLVVPQWTWPTACFKSRTTVGAVDGMPSLGPAPIPWTVGCLRSPHRGREQLILFGRGVRTPERRRRRGDVGAWCEVLSARAGLAEPL
jgi:hypothetical protein